ncbi:MAG TPA: 1,4-dihydroxy-2-naphthoate polyprenyltransferase [Actinomycetota bacterium]|jgi:1,4-dihydroxy-2-naphthoate octaprenyltransferase
MSPAGVWIEAARPKTLVAMIVPVLVGTAASGAFVPRRFVATMVAGLAMQVGTNYANDYFDGVKGVDVPHRAGPRRATASGLVTPAQMKRAMILSFAVASLAGLVLTLDLGLIVPAAGAVCLLAALAYSGGPKPYGSAGLGEVVVFGFFGLVATAGSAFAETGRLTLAAIVASLPVGLLAAAILVANNLRDIDTDRVAGKITLAVRLGRERTRALYRGMILGAYALVPVVAVVARRQWALLPLLTLPLALRPVRLVDRRDDAPGLVQALVATARLELVFGLLFAAGLWVR